jgi:hypothetical protein
LLPNDFSSSLPIWPATLVVTLRVTFRTMTWLVDSRLPRVLVPKMHCPPWCRPGA